MRGKVLRVGELVAAGLHWQRHCEVVALSKTEKQVLHGGAGRFVGLEEGHIGVLQFQVRAGVQREGRTIEVEGLCDPGERKGRDEVIKSPLTEK